MHAVRETSPLVKLTPLSTNSEDAELKGYKFIFAGSVIAINNRRGHELTVSNTPDRCLDHVSLASISVRR